MARPRIGIWLIGVKGGVAATAIVGLCALKRGAVGHAGLVTELPQFRHLDLAAWDDFLVGGHEIRNVRLADEAMRLVTESRAVDPELIDQCKPELDEIDRRTRFGTIRRVGPTISQLAAPEVPRDESPRAIIARVQKDLAGFQQAHALEHVIVVNVASTEPPVDVALVPPTWAELERQLDRPDQCALPASSLYAVAALDSGCSYVNFTPSLGSRPPAIGELALARATRHIGCDSLLAAPLVLDLIRFTELARRRGETGTLTFLASFFKSPYGVDQQSFIHQFQMLEAWARDEARGTTP